MVCRDESQNFSGPSFLTFWICIWKLSLNRYEYASSSILHFVLRLVMTRLRQFTFASHLQGAISPPWHPPGCLESSGDKKITHQLCQKTQMLKSKFLRSISMEATRQNIYGDKAAPAIQAVNREGKVHHSGPAREDHGRATLTFKSPSSFLLTFSTSARAFFSLSQCSFVCNTKNNNAYELRSNKQKNASTK